MLLHGKKVDSAVAGPGGCAALLGHVTTRSIACPILWRPTLFGNGLTTLVQLCLAQLVCLAGCSTLFTA